ncbi:MAG: hypothetical protein Q8O79_08530 [Pseudomonadota bacterium]|nr:hypothetical protein [Pseudomonadota bacterium]
MRAIKLDARSFPALFNADYEAVKERYWGWLAEMAAWGWFQLKLARHAPGLADYELSPRLVVEDESRIRQALGRPHRIRSTSEVWRDAVFAKLLAAEDVKEQVARSRMDIPGRGAAEIVSQLNLLPTLRDEPLLLREVSARLFWGLSKVLDGRRWLVSIILGVDECPFPQMPVQLQVYLPKSGFDAVLFIENQVTFESAVMDETKRFAGLALVFSSGFKGSARRLRTPSGASVYFAAAGSLEVAAIDKFQSWRRAVLDLPCWFWGDLDYSGMGILASLRNSFRGIGAWEPGYQPMWHALRRGEGHEPKSAKKENQIVLTATGCSYADRVLLPALADAGLFVDQEGVDPSWDGLDFQPTAHQPRAPC